MAQNGQPLTVSGVLTNDANSPVSGQTVTFTLGSGSTTQTCTAVTTATGAVVVRDQRHGQPQGPIPVHGHLRREHRTTSRRPPASTVNLPEGTTLTVSPGTGTYNTPGTVSGTLVNTYTNAPGARASRSP